VTTTMMRSAVSQTMSEVPGDEEPEQLLFGLIGDKTKCELAQGHEVLIRKKW